MTIIERLKIRYVSIYEPDPSPWNETKDPVFGIVALGKDNPERDLPWNPRHSPRTGEYYTSLSFKSKRRIKVTCMVEDDYSRLRALYERMIIRNLPVDTIFRGATVDVVLFEDNTISEIIIRDYYDLNTEN